jgi:hypothetical protein
MAAEHLKPKYGAPPADHDAIVRDVQIAFDAHDVVLGEVKGGWLLMMEGGASPPRWRRCYVSVRESKSRSRSATAAQCVRARARAALGSPRACARLRAVCGGVQQRQCFRVAPCSVGSFSMRPPALPTRSATSFPPRKAS